MTDIFTPEALETLRAMAFNAVWVLGAAIDLAVASWVIYELRLGNGSLSSLLEKPVFSRSLLIGTMLVMIGAALTASALWRVILYCIMALLLLVRFVMDMRTKVNDNDKEN